MDVSQFPIDSSADMRIWERRLLYCVPVSCLNPISLDICDAWCFLHNHLKSLKLSLLLSLFDKINYPDQDHDLVNELAFKC